MSQQPDQQWIDKFTNIDNLLYALNQNQQNTNFLLQQLLEKPTILNAPNLQNVVMENKAVYIPENTSITPKYYVDTENDKYYKLLFNITSSGQHPLTAISPNYDSGVIPNFDIILKSYGAQLIFINKLKYIWFALGVQAGTSSTQIVKINWFKNSENIITNLNAVFGVWNEYIPDPTNIAYYIHPGDQMRFTITNNNAINIEVYKEEHYSFYKEIPKEQYILYYNHLKNIFS